MINGNDPVCTLRFTFDTVFGKHSVTVDISVQDKIIKDVMDNVSSLFKLLPKLLLRGK